MQRNPFRIQTSEQSSTQDEFLSLFESEVLEILRTSGLWNRLVILEAAPGAGKSTMLRLFTPEVLKQVHRNRTRTENSALIKRLEDLGAISHSDIRVLGTLVSCRGQYSAIDDLSIEQPEKGRWFFGLLDARIALLTLRSLCVFADLQYPSGLSRVRLLPIGEVADVARTTELGISLFDEAARREDILATAIDSLTKYEVDRTAFRTNLDTLRMLSASRFELDGVELPIATLTMFDDVQDLVSWQQEALIEDLENRDIRAGRWVARRLDVLSIDELLPSGGKEGRDYEVRRIEDWARNDRTRFERLLVGIADRRIRKTNLGVNSFASLLNQQLASQRELEKTREAATREQSSVLNAHGDKIAYSEWIENTTTEQYEESHSHLTNAKRWRALEILTHRRRNRTNSQSINEPRSKELLLQQRSSDVMTAAELLISVTHDVPFYYGTERLAGLASANIEQFLRIGGAVFDKIVMLQVTGRRHSLTATEQDSITRSLARSTIASLPRNVPFGSDVQRLVQAIGTFAREVTAREAASYSPGILGVGLRQSQFKHLLNPDMLDQRPELLRLKDVLQSSISHNVLEPRGPKRVKGEIWMVLYLNRLFSPAFDLPTVSSQFQGIHLDDLLTWLSHGYRPVSRQDRLLL